VDWFPERGTSGEGSLFFDFCPGQKTVRGIFGAKKGALRRRVSAPFLYKSSASAREKKRRIS